MSYHQLAFALPVTGSLTAKMAPRKQQRAGDDKNSGAAATYGPNLLMNNTDARPG